MRTLWNFWLRVGEDRLMLVAAGVAFYALLSLIPAITALLAIGGLVLNPGDIITEITDFDGIVPQEALVIIANQARRVAATENADLGWTLALSLALALWSASRGLASLVQGLNIIGGVTESRNFFSLNLQVIGLTLLVGFGLLLAIGVLVVLPIGFSYVDWGATELFITDTLRWLVLLGMTVIGLCVIYSVGADAPRPPWGGVVGAVFGALAWIGVSWSFTEYLSRFSGWAESFGALAGVIVMLMWLWLSALVVLLGALINDEMRRAKEARR